MPVTTRKRISSSQPVLKISSQRLPRQNHGSLKSNAAHAQAAKRISFAAQTGVDIIANVDDSCVRDILLVQDTQLKKQEKAIAKLTSMVEELKQLLFSRQQHAEPSRNADAALSYAAVVGKSTGPAPVLPTPRQGDICTHRHWEAQLRGYTREIRLFVRNGSLSNAQVEQLLAAESGVSQIEGVSWKRVQEGKVVVVMCRDERHRQSVFRQIRKNRRSSSLEVTVQCWLSALQRQNKQEIYRWANEAGKDKILAFDWGDRLLLNRVTGGRNQPENRYVLDLSLPLGKVQAQLYSLWTKWGIQLVNNRPVAGPKRDRQKPAEQPLPTSGDIQDVEMSGGRAKTKCRSTKGKSRASKQPIERELEQGLPGPPPRGDVGDEQGTEWHDAAMEGDEAGPSRPAEAPAQQD